MTALQTALSTARDLSAALLEASAPKEAKHFDFPAYRAAHDAYAEFARTFTDNAVMALETAEKYLTEIASFGEGPVVTGSFDEPGAAQGARDALAAMDRAFEP